MIHLNKEQATFYRERWKAVYEIEARERAALTPEERLRQIAMLHDFARWAGRGRAFKHESEVRQRWAWLREHAGESPSRTSEDRLPG